MEAGGDHSQWAFPPSHRVDFLGSLGVDHFQWEGSPRHQVGFVAWNCGIVELLNCEIVGGIVELWNRGIVGLWVELWSCGAMEL